MPTNKSAVVCVLSTFKSGASQKEEVYYFSQGSMILTFKGLQTNEAPVKSLIKEASQNGHPVEKVFCLTSEEARDALDRFESEIKNYKRFLDEDDELRIEPIDYDMGNPEASLAQLIECLESYNHVYFDITGGGRDASILMVLAVQLLKMREDAIEIPDIVYSNRNEKRIISQLGTFELGSLRSAIEAFVDYGKADKLAEYFEGKSVLDETTELCKAIKHFSDALALCQVKNIIELVRKVHEAILCSLDAYNTRHKEGSWQLSKSELLLGSLLPTIQNRFIQKTSDDDEVLIDTIRWCVNRQMVQQALAIFREHIPQYVINKGLLSPKGKGKKPEWWLKGLSNVYEQEAADCVDREKILEDISCFFEENDLILIDEDTRNKLHEAFLLAKPDKYAKRYKVAVDATRRSQLSAILIWFRYITLVRNMIMHADTPKTFFLDFSKIYRHTFGEKRYPNDYSLDSIRHDIDRALAIVAPSPDAMYDSNALQNVIGELAAHATTISYVEFNQIIESLRKEATIEQPYLFEDKLRQFGEYDYNALARVISERSDAFDFVPYVRVKPSSNNNARKERIKKYGGIKKMKWDNCWEQLKDKLVAYGTESNCGTFSWKEFDEYAKLPRKQKFGVRDKEPRDEILSKLVSKSPDDFALIPCLKCNKPLSKIQPRESCGASQPTGPENSEAPKSLDSESRAIDQTTNNEILNPHKSATKKKSTSQKQPIAKKDPKKSFGVALNNRLNPVDVEKLMAMKENLASTQ